MTAPWTPHHREGRSKSGGAERHGIVQRESVRERHHPVAGHPCDLRIAPVVRDAALALLRRQAACLGLQLSLTLATLLTLPFTG